MCSWVNWQWTEEEAGAVLPLSIVARQHFSVSLCVMEKIWKMKSEVKIIYIYIYLKIQTQTCSVGNREKKDGINYKGGQTDTRKWEITWRKWSEIDKNGRKKEKHLLSACFHPEHLCVWVSLDHCVSSSHYYTCWGHQRSYQVAGKASSVCVRSSNNRRQT